ncbi:MAG: SDR family NAD(P)-dependent oxidoreductase [Candidatus Aenigmatarchaeota archaeon]
MNFNGHTAIVTGAACGIGRAIALKLGREGANVVVGDLDPDPELEENPTHEKIQQEGGDAIFVETDVSDEKSVQELVYTAAEEFGKIDVLVNNAGIYHPASVTDESLEDWSSLLEVNLTGYFLCSKHVLEHMLEENIEGDIVNIGSIAGLVGYGESAAYCAAKGGVVELTREMALDYGSEGINVNAVDPGVIKTAMTKDLREDKETRQFMEQNTVSPRLGEPEDIANAVAFLASNESDFIMGENLVVDGGWTAK